MEYCRKMLGVNRGNADQLFVFVDESGNFDFTGGGTNHFVMAAVMTADPISSSMLLQRLKYDLMTRNQDIAYFRASKNLRWVKDEVIQLFKQVELSKVHVTYGKKDELPPHLRSGLAMFQDFSILTSKEALRVANSLAIERINIVFDQAVSSRQQVLIRAAILRALVDKRNRLTVHFQQVSTDFNGQIADFVAWAKFRQLERDDHEYWNLLSKTLRPTEFNVVKDWPSDADFE